MIDKLKSKIDEIRKEQKALFDTAHRAIFDKHYSAGTLDEESFNAELEVESKAVDIKRENLYSDIADLKVAVAHFENQEQIKRALLLIE